jgi:hypothetical protein
MNYSNKYVYAWYVPNKLYELTEQMCIDVEHILQNKETKYLYIHKSYMN